jgi:ectoine hydroxylase-related dioxygenase (phytanoyl-CoA dioxygenase family)
MVPPVQEGPGKTRWHLTGEQVRFYDENGYLILRKWITGELLERLQAAGQAWIAQGMQAPTELTDDSHDKGYSDYVFANRSAGRVMYRVNYIHNKGQDASLELLGSPQVLAVAESLCGPNFVPTYESMVFKQQGDGEVIRWHQDAVHPHERFRIYNFDLYLDRSSLEGGALRVIPKSQSQGQDICRIAADHGWDPPGMQVVEMEPGDVLLHDVMIVHGSPRVEGKALRRTLYYEFRAAEEILQDGPWDRDWIAKRTRLVPVALKRHQARFPQAAQFQWNPAPEFRPAPLANDAEELKVAHLVHTPASFCSAGDAIYKR